MGVWEFFLAMTTPQLYKQPGHFSSFRMTVGFALILRRIFSRTEVESKTGFGVHYPLMKVSFMRIVDRWAGIPLCFLLTWLRAVGLLFSRPKPWSPPRKILFLEISEMGSMVLALPLFRKTQELFPDAELYFCTFRHNRPAMDILGVIPESQVLTIEGKNLAGFVISTWRALRRLRKLRLDLVVDMELFARFTAALSLLSGARLRAGYFRFHNEGLYRGRLLTHPVAFNPHVHMAHNLLALIHAASREAKELPPQKFPLEKNNLSLPEHQIPETVLASLYSKLRRAGIDPRSGKRIILLNPNASDLIPLRRWPLENYVELARRLLDRSPDHLVVITGTAEERSRTEKLAQSIGSPRCFNLAGETSLPELLALYSVSHILVTNDSGPVHFSSLTDIHTVALFGPETPELYGPLGTNSRVLYAGYACSPCVSAFNHRRSPCTNNRCLQAISVEQVLEAVLSRLHGD